MHSFSRYVDPSPCRHEDGAELIRKLYENDAARRLTEPTLWRNLRSVGSVAFGVTMIFIGLILVIIGALPGLVQVLGK